MNADVPLDLKPILQRAVAAGVPKPGSTQAGVIALAAEVERLRGRDEALEAFHAEVGELLDLPAVDRESLGVLWRATNWLVNEAPKAAGASPATRGACSSGPGGYGADRLGAVHGDHADTRRWRMP